ncbi:MAG: hypothetical protein EPN85_14115 [Bacteroidetes bacterium]|nr:MAG: hypothetical protein EPN85_14115 [Bacteroidota bacterium]
MKIFFTLLFLLVSILSSAQTKFIHVFVALCDNESQGIVPVPKKIGNGNDPDNNLYWGCAFGMRTYFKNATEWQHVSTAKNVSATILERCIFKHRTKDAIIIADGYKGTQMRACLNDFFLSSSGNDTETIRINEAGIGKVFPPGSADLVVFIGHDGLMDTRFEAYPVLKGTKKRDAMIFCCYSKEFFTPAMKSAGANPLLWTTGLCSPEAYSLKAGLDGWLLQETGIQIEERAAQAYHKYQKCGIKGARGLFTTGW